MHEVCPGCVNEICTANELPFLNIYILFEGHLCASQQYCPPEVLSVPLVLADIPGDLLLPSHPLQARPLPPPCLQGLRH